MMKPAATAHSPVQAASSNSGTIERLIVDHAAATTSSTKATPPAVRPT